MFGVSTSTVYNYVQRGIRVSNDIYVRLERGDSSRFDKASLIKFIEQTAA
ncbi:MAG: helix-turn-helix domain-containing protein [Saprospiraceae bacterium]|nr:helix-turn-helix domain-containing protein [Saprospiraceae bacterium]